MQVNLKAWGRESPLKEYQKFASVYDRMGADSFSIEMVDYTMRIMKRLRKRPETVLDLCCGTGSALQLFHERKLQVTGLDGSAAMLKQARKKLVGTRTTFHCQRLPRFDIFKKSNKGIRRQRTTFDLVTCYYDALNYLLTRKELESSFAAVYKHLNAGGCFVFDMNTPEGLKTIWGDNCWGEARDDLAWIWINKSFPKKDIAECRTTFFIKTGRLWKRFDELHVERGYSDNVIKQSLRKAGFRIRGFYRCLSFNKPTAKTARVCAIAERLG